MKGMALLTYVSLAQQETRGRLLRAERADARPARVARPARRSRRRRILGVLRPRLA